MSSIVIQGDTSGSVTLQAPNVAGSAVITLPSTSGTLTSVSSLSNNGVVFADGAGQLTNNAGFTFDGTTLTTPGNTVLGDASTDTLNVGNGGLVKDASGNVGIGTATPGFKLVVSKDGAEGIEFVPGGTSNVSTTQYYNRSGAAYTANAQDASYHSWLISGAERMRIDSSGNVGIGTSSPSSFTAENESKLTVGTGSGNGGITVYTGNTSQGGIFFADGTSGAATYSGILRYNHSDNSMLFYTNGLNERMRIDSSGMVLPGATATYDLGSSSLRWRNVYTSDLHLNNGIGNYTIVEGEEDLFLYNNKNGKTYKFALIEVDKSEAPPKMKED